MLRVFADAGLQAQRALADGVYDLTFPLPSGEEDITLGTYRDAVAERERSAGVASLRHALAPAAVAVIGASRRPGSVGRAILRSIVTSGFSGPVYAVNPAVTELEGVPCVPSAAALPEGFDLAVIATPAAAVPGIAEECGRRGVKALVVLAAGLSGAARSELLGICRRHGMRMVGPGSFGVADTKRRPGRHVRGPPPRAGKRGPGAAVDRWRRLRLGRAPVADRRRDLLPRLAGRQRRRGRHRHAAVVGVRPGDQAGPAVCGVDRGTRPSSPARPAASAAACRS